MPILDPIARVGQWAAFAARAVVAALLTVARPQDWLRPFYSALIGGLPLAALLGVALGAVVWMHTRSILERSVGNTEYLPTALAAAVLLELGPVGAGMIVAARTGATLGAELSSMTVNEQVDALELLGVSPMNRLVGPRVLACVLAVPLLHVVVSGLAIGNGFAAEAVGGSMTWAKYQTLVLQELRLNEVLPAGLKTLAFGALIGATGCFVGLTARGGSEGVGKAATNSVVACTLLVLIADVLLVGVIRALS
jgi:phospholipid/cholesterol/gamma-HCH transport system permease protein